MSEIEYAQILEEQKRYYSARAPEYDQWWLRQGKKFDRGAEFNTRWESEKRALKDALKRFGPKGQVLELASGTGLWTAELVRTADQVTAVDVSPEMTLLNRARLGKANVRYVQADILGWKPDRQYDVVFFSFWLSHVPEELLPSFWRMVRHCLKPNGRVFFIDNSPDEVREALQKSGRSYDGKTDTRTLNDGRAFQIIKVLYAPKDLEERLGGLG